MRISIVYLIHSTYVLFLSLIRIFLVFSAYNYFTISIISLMVSPRFINLYYFKTNPGLIIQDKILTYQQECFDSWSKIIGNRSIKLLFSLGSKMIRNLRNRRDIGCFTVFKISIPSYLIQFH